MGSQRPAPSAPTARIALVIYLSLVGAVVITLVMSIALQSLGTFPRVGGAMLGWAPMLVGVFAAAGAYALRQRLPERGSGQAEDAWWQANLPRAVAIWAIGEGVALLGSVFFLVASRPVSLAATALGLAILALSTPATLAGR